MIQNTQTTLKTLKNATTERVFSRLYSDEKPSLGNLEITRPRSNCNACVVSEKQQNKRDRRFQLLNEVSKLLPNETVSKCLKNRVYGAETVGVSLDNQGTASYTRLQTCKSVWACPCCSSRISTGRANELQRLVDRAKERNHAIHLVTLTHRHNKSHALSDILRVNRSALKRMFSGRPYRKLLEKYGILGYVKGQEITHSERNGWHNHYHLIVITNGDIDRAELQKELAKKWLKAWQKSTHDSGMHPNLSNGVDVADGSKAQKYIAKTADQNSKQDWGVSQEIALSHIKRAKGESRTPWDLLGDSKDLKGAESTRAGLLFIEYYNAIKGTRQLNWSKDLRTMFGIDDLTDEEIIEQETAIEKTEIKTIQPLLWNLIVSNRKRSEVLRLCEYDNQNRTNKYEMLCIHLLDQAINSGQLLGRHTINIYIDTIKDLVKTIE